MKILFLNPPNDPFSSKGILIEPVDLLQCASYAEKIGFEVFAFDMDVKKCYSEDLDLFFKNKHFEIVIAVFDHHIPLHDTKAGFQAQKALKYFKDKGSFTALAGKSASFNPSHMFSCLHVDVLIHKEIEPFLDQLKLKGIPKSLNQLQSFKSIRYWRHGQLFSTPWHSEFFDLNKIPSLNRSLLDIEDYIDVRTILTSRGCNLKCTFCHVPGYWGGWRARKPSLVCQEILEVQKKYQGSKILLLDDNATAQPLRMKEISEELIHLGNKAPLGCLATIVSYHQKTFETMFQAGFRWIHFGAESADDWSLKTMLKRTDFETTCKVIENCRQIGFRLRTSWVLDMPDTTLDSLQRTCQGILKLKTPEIRLHFLALRLGSQLAQKYGAGSKQYIHNSGQNVNLTKIDPVLFENTVNALIKELIEQGYTLVTNPEEFKNISNLKKDNPSLKIVSLCPLRYGLNWEF